MNIKAVLFDCDGVLVDSEFIYVNSLVDYLKTIGINTTVDEMVCVLGSPVDAIVEKVRDMFNLYEKMGHEELLLAQRAFFQKRFKAAKLEPMPNLVKFLKLLKSKNIKTAIVSSSNQKYLEDIIKRLNLEGYFDEVIAGESVKYGKPNPDIYLFAQDRIGLAKEDIVIIEDSYNGIKAGKTAGIYTIGYKASVITQDTSAADIEIHDYQELFDFI